MSELKTIHEVSKLTGLSIRALRHYDAIGLLHPAKRNASGYRLYSKADLERLQHILLFKELEFPLKDIKHILDSPEFDQRRALEQQIALLELKQKHIEALLVLANTLKETGVPTMNFDAFDTSKLDQYAKEAKASWGETAAWKEYEQKSINRTKIDEMNIGDSLMDLFKPFGAMAAKNMSPESAEAIRQAELIQSFISTNYYQCNDEMFAQLGQMYSCGNEFTQNINAAAGSGAAEFATQAIEAYLANK